ncbi:sensor histidine kinase [Microbacterium sp. DT81.1]|uniref:sensor histidine kinase n=1 Tax=Microbacterium sp. DT81.1 TaxID=3393413 RepID=UPI003CEC9BB2
MTTAEDRVRNPAPPRPWFPGWVGDVIAGLFIVAAAFVPYTGEEFRPASPLTLAIALAPVLVIPVRRRLPIPALAACVLLYGIAAFTGTLAPGIVLATAITMFGVANRTNRRTTILVAVVAIVVILPLSRLATISDVLDPRAFQFAVTVAFAAAAGDATRSRREYVRAVTERAERAEQTRDSEARRRVTEERLRIARDLHDAVAHQISVISLNAGVASFALESRPEKAREALSTIRVASRAVLAEIGDLLAMLRAEDDGSSGIGAAPQPGLARLDELVGRFGESGMRVTVRVDGDISRLPGAVDLVAYRVIQEGLTNAHKHGAEHRAHVLVAVGDRQVDVAVSNPVPSAAAHPVDLDAGTGGRGLLGLRERVASVRGSVETGPTPGGYRIAATLPLPEESST